MTRKDVTDARPVQSLRCGHDELDVEDDETGNDLADVPHASVDSYANGVGEPSVDGGDRGDLDERAVALPREVLGGVERCPAANADDDLGLVVEQCSHLLEMNLIHVAGFDQLNGGRHVAGEP